MDWSRTKTVFIIAFLILDIFLVYQLIEKNNSKFEFISESSIEEQLAAEEITYVELPKVDLKEIYITGNRKVFQMDDFARFKNQSYSFISENSVVSILKEPFSIDKNNFELSLAQFVKEYVYAGDSYSFWGWNSATNKILFFQTYKGMPIYFSESGMLALQVNENAQIVGYEQTMLENIEEIYDENSQQTLSSMKALESLYNKNYLKSNSSVTSISLGYYTVVPVSGDVQFFAPSWHIVVDDEIDYFVNAIEGHVVELLESGVENNEFAF